MNYRNTAKKLYMTHYILRTWWNLEFESGSHFERYEETVEYLENKNWISVETG